LHKWFDEAQPGLKETLDERFNTLWKRVVIAPLMQMTEEQQPEVASDAEAKT
jgi:hypothetical protein